MGCITFDYLWVFLVLCAIGLGPAVALARWCGNAALLFQSLPIGMAVLVMFVFPCYRWGGPIQGWGTSVTLALMCFSLLWAFFAVARGGFSLRRIDLLGVAVVACCTIILVGLTVRMVHKGYVYYDNPADALTYMSAGEAVFQADLDLIIAGGQDSFHQGELASVSPASLFSARFISKGYRLGTAVNLAVLSSLTGNDATKSYMLLGFLSWAAIIAATWGLARQLRLGWAGSTAVAFAVPFCGLAELFAHQDALSQLQALSLLLTMAALMILILETSGGNWLYWMIFGMVLTGMTTVYPEVFPVVASVFGMVFLLAKMPGRGYWAGRLDLFKKFAPLAVTFLICSAGHLDYNIQTLSLGYTNTVMIKMANWSLPLIYSGDTGLVILESEFFLWDWLIPLAGVITVPLLLRRGFPELVIAAFLLTICLAICSGLAMESRYFIGKSFIWVFPWSFFALALLQQYFWRRRSSSPWKGLVAVLLMALLVEQGGRVLDRIRREYTNRYQIVSYLPPTQPYLVAEIVESVKKLQPRHLLVDVPMTIDYIFPYLAIVLFGRYPAQFVNGIVMDNSTKYPLFKRTKVFNNEPDFAIIEAKSGNFKPLPGAIRMADGGG